MPGAYNCPFASNVTDNGRFRPAAELRAELLELLVGREPSAFIAMCGSGVTACQLLALEVADLHGGALYAGSWSDPRPVPAHPDGRRALKNAVSARIATSVLGLRASAMVKTR